MRLLTIIGFVLMFLGPLIVLLRSIGVRLVDDVYVQMGIGLVVFLFGWGIVLYSGNKIHQETIVRLKEAHDELTRLHSNGVFHRFKQSLPEIRKDLGDCNVDTLLMDPKDLCSKGGRDYKQFSLKVHPDKNKGCPKWADDVTKKCNAVRPK